MKCTDPGEGLEEYGGESYCVTALRWIPLVACVNPGKMHMRAAAVCGTRTGPGWCPECGSDRVTMTGVRSSWHPTGGTPGHRIARLGDPGTEDNPTTSQCHHCGRGWITYPRKPSQTG